MNIDELMDGDTTFATLYNFGNSNPGNFVFGDNGRYLYGASYYTGVSNIFRYDLAADSMEALSNCETGFFRPIPISEESLIVFRYSTKGFVPAVIAIQPLEDVSAIRYLGQTVSEIHPAVRDWMAGSPGDVPIDSLIVKSGTYRGLKNFRPVSAYPVVEGYKDYAAFGMRIDFSDLLEMHNGDLTATYTPNTNVPVDERWHARWDYSYFGLSLAAKYNGASFYDLFGPTKTSRKGYSLAISYDKNLIFDRPRMMDLTVGVAGYGGLERLPSYQNIATSYDRFLGTSATLTYQNMRASLGAVDYEQGFVWQLSLDGTYVIKRYFPQSIIKMTTAVPLPLNHSAILLRASAGYAPGDRYEPFANFYFGGFGNNWVDHLSIKRYRAYYSFPGLELNEIGGTNFGKVGIEWALPPLRFRRFGFPALYCSWAHLTLFSSALITNMDSVPDRRRAANLGTQLDLRMQLLSQLRLTLSVGYAVAAEKSRQRSEEFMISLKVL